MDKKKFCISFAGAIGSSKTPIAYYLQERFNLIMLNNDIIRTEVKEDFGYLNTEEYEKRRNFRVEEMLQSGRSFIFDASIDRSWDVFHQYLVKYDYAWFVISLDLSKELLKKLYLAKGYSESLLVIDQYFADHEKFLSLHDSDINLHITDETFTNRLNLSEKAFTEWLNDLSIENN